MAKLSFLDQLNGEQLEYARIIGEKAKEMGIPPTLAIAIAYQESKLNPNAPRGADGEYGIMQVMPKTGKGMGFTNKDLADPAKNIEAGLKYLKQNLDAFNGDAKLATIGYNAGTDSSFFFGGNLPNVTKQYLKDMNDYGAYSDGVVTQPTEQPESREMVTADAPPPPPPVPDVSGATAGERFLGGALGAGVGTLASGAQGVSNVRTGTAATRAGAEETARIAAQRSAGVVPPTALGAVPSGGPAPPVGSTIMRQPIPSGGADAGRLAAGQTGTMPYNYAKAAGLTDIEAGRALDMTKQTGGVHDLTSQRREGLNKIQNMFPGEKYVENPRYGGLLTPDQGVGGGPRQSFKVQGALPAADVPPNFMPGPNAPPPAGSLVQLPKPVPIPTTPPPPSVGARVMSGLDTVTDLFKSMMRPVTSAVGTVGKYALPPLAGLSAGLDLAEMGSEYNKPEDQRDYTKMGLKAASAIGGGLSMIPATAPLGIPLSLGATAAQAYREDPEYFKQKIKEYTGYAP
jgi:hypothetical protein